MEKPTSAATVPDQNTIVEVIVGRTGDPVRFLVTMTKTALDQLGGFDTRKRRYKREKGPETFRTGGLVFSNRAETPLFSIPVNEIGLVHDGILAHFNFKPCEKYPNGKFDVLYEARNSIIRLQIPELLMAA